MSNHYPRWFHETDQEYRRRPAKFTPYAGERGWYQDGRRFRNVKAPKAFVWPKDGKNGTSWGRFKDILRNQGPDMYVTINAEKHDYMHNRPSRASWSGYPTLDDRNVGNVCTFSSKKPAPWVKKGILGGGREWGKSYDFRTRKYEYPNRYTWTDAVWQTGPWKNKHNPYPEAVRNVYGQWFQDDHYLRQFMGGPVSNERGRGWPGVELH